MQQIPSGLFGLSVFYLGFQHSNLDISNVPLSTICTETNWDRFVPGSKVISLCHRAETWWSLGTLSTNQPLRAQGKEQLPRLYGLTSFTSHLQGKNTFLVLNAHQFLFIKAHGHLTPPTRSLFSSLVKQVLWKKWVVPIYSSFRQSWDCQVWFLEPSEWGKMDVNEPNFQSDVIWVYSAIVQL